MKDWINSPIEGVGGIVKVFIITFFILPLAGFVVWFVFMAPLYVIGYGLSWANVIGEGVCDGGRYDADC